MGTNAVPALAASGSRDMSLILFAPSTAGTYYYGACVDAVSDESNTGNNCSSGVRVTVEEDAGTGAPDLVVESPSVSDSTLTTGETFTFSATVRNRGNGRSGSTTLRYYRSPNSSITTSDTQVGTDSVFDLSASGSSPESVSLTAPSSAGTYYYGTCVDAVSGESNTGNNCSSGTSVTVSDNGGGSGGTGVSGGDGVVPEIEMVSIPGGTFQMGDLSGDGLPWERPVHSVTVPAFKLGKYEVTYAQWDACSADGGCEARYNVCTCEPQFDDCTADGGEYQYGDEESNCPFTFATWFNAYAFIDWLNSKTDGGYRLPTEAEWEYAARAGSTTKYSWGDDIGHNRANCDHDCGDQWIGPAPVGSFPANAWGLHDMHGNVLEWVQDCWNDNYEGAPSDGSAWETGDCSASPARGGSWRVDPWFLRSASRYIFDRSFDPLGIARGFRLAQD